MDGTRPRRTLDRSRQGWYSHWRSVRFARHLGFPTPSALRALSGVPGQPVRQTPQ
jgi:hypothetical protein